MSEIIAPEVGSPRGRPTLPNGQHRKRLTATISDYTQAELKAVAKRYNMSEGQALDFVMVNAIASMKNQFGYTPIYEKETFND